MGQSQLHVRRAVGALIGKDVGWLRSDPGLNHR